MTLLSATVLLLLIMDPFGNMVPINSLLADWNEKERSRIIMREHIIAYALLVLVLFIGAPVLSLLNIEQPTLNISGAIILFLIAIGMVFPTKSVTPTALDEEPLIVPIAIPLIAGPSAMATIMLMASKHPEMTLRWLGAISIAIGISALILGLSPYLFRYLKRRAAIAVERLMGMILVMVSVQMFLDGLQMYLNNCK